MKIALITADKREDSPNESGPMPLFDAAPELLIKAFASMPELEVHVLSCTQKPMRSPEKLAENTWFHNVYVPKAGWARSSYQGCIRGVRRQLKILKADIAHGLGTERECAISAAFSRFPNVVTIYANMAEQSRLSNAPMGSELWLAGQLEEITLKRAKGVICHSQEIENRVKPRASRSWTLLPAAEQPDPQVLAQRHLEIYREILGKVS
jgi:hypothetical protein